MKNGAKQSSRDRQLEAALREADTNRAQLESVFNALSDGVVITDMGGNFVLTNPAQAKISGFKNQAEMRQSLAEYKGMFDFWEADGTKVPETEWPLAKVLRGESVVRWELKGRRNDTGKEWYYSFSGEPVRDKHGRQSLAVVITRDITDRKRLEQQKEDFLAVASHELKTPVTSIKAFAQVLRESFRRKGDTASAELLTKMDKQINKLTNLIRDLMDVTKVQTHKLRFNFEKFRFDALVQEVVEEIQRTTQHRIVDQLNANTVVMGDRDRIGQTISNLLVNAIKYSPQAKTIKVTTKVDPTSVTFMVTDYGIGIPKDKQHRVFEQFYRENESTTDTYGGLGLGLYISSEIIQHHNGRIWVKSTVGKGSTFGFSLPLTQAATRLPSIAPKHA